MFPILVLGWTAAPPAHAFTEIERANLQVRINMFGVEDCRTPHVDTNNDGESPAEGDPTCEADGEGGYRPKPLWNLGFSCDAAVYCGAAGHFRDGPSDEHGIEPHPVPWIVELEGYFAAGGGALPEGLVVLDDNLERIESVLDTGEGEVIAGVEFPGGFASDVLFIGVTGHPEFADYLVVADEERAAGVAFGNIGAYRAQ